MKRRSFLTKSGKRITLGGLLSVVFNPFELTRAVGSFYIHRQQNPRVPRGGPLQNGSRQLREETFQLEYEWRDRHSRQWQLDFEIDRAAYVEAAEKSWGYLQAFSTARSNSHARQLGEALSTATARRSPADNLSRAEQLEQAVGFVAAIEYSVDHDSKGVVEYHRTPEETLVDGNGDCKDLTYLLAGILSQPPFAYRTAMVILPEHMLVGVHTADLPAVYNDAPRLPNDEYVAIESTADRPIGEYRDKPVLAIYDRGFSYVDHDAIAETTGNFIRNPTSFEVVTNLH